MLPTLLLIFILILGFSFSPFPLLSSLPSSPLFYSSFHPSPLSTRFSSSSSRFSSSFSPSSSLLSFSQLVLSFFSLFFLSSSSLFIPSGLLQKTSRKVNDREKYFELNLNILDINTVSIMAYRICYNCDSCQDDDDEGGRHALL
jgi:hypothetical protein